MGQRGPRRMSSEQLRINGSRIDDGRGMANPPGVPLKPDWIAGKPIASCVWDETLAELAVVPGLLSRLDAGALALYCDSWQQFHDASKIIDGEGLVATSEKGSVYQHPAVGIRNKALEAILKVGSKFGMDPPSREGMIVSGPTADDELAELIR